MDKVSELCIRSFAATLYPDWFLNFTSHSEAVLISEYGICINVVCDGREVRRV